MSRQTRIHPLQRTDSAGADSAPRQPSELPASRSQTFKPTETKHAGSLLRYDPTEAPDEDLVTPASEELILGTLTGLGVLLGHRIGGNRQAALVMYLQAEGWTEAEVRTAARALAKDQALADRIEHGQTVVPANFERMRTGGAVAEARLYTYAEMRREWERLGGSTYLPMTRLFRPVKRAGQPVRFRRRGIGEDELERAEIEMQVQGEPTPQPAAPRHQRHGGTASLKDLIEDAKEIPS